MFFSFDYEQERQLGLELFVLEIKLIFGKLKSLLLAQIQIELFRVIKAQPTLHNIHHCKDLNFSCAFIVEKHV